MIRLGVIGTVLGDLSSLINQRFFLTINQKVSITLYRNFTVPPEPKHIKPWRFNYLGLRRMGDV